MTATIDASATKRADKDSWLDKPADGPAVQQNAATAQSPETYLSIPARYQILSQAGSGGMGIVYKVRDLETDEIIALKVLKPEIAADEAMRENLRKEVCLARRVTHKNVCRIYEFNRATGTACVSMEFVEGESLLAKLKTVGSISAAESIEITRQICAGLREAHAQGIVHRDLKPANIMLDRSGNVKIMDFGIARLSHGNAQMTGTIAGTPAYMAPEQVELGSIGPPTDIYALGLLLYEMVTGAPPFTGDTPIVVALKQIRQIPTRPSEIVSTLSPHLEAVILKCLRKNFERRFQSVDELDAALQKAARMAQPAQTLAGFEVPPALQGVMPKARAAASQLTSAAVEVRHASIELFQSSCRSLEKRASSIRAQDFRAPAIIRSASVAAILGVTFLSTAVTFGVVTRKASSGQQTVAESPAAFTFPGVPAPYSDATSILGTPASYTIAPFNTGEDANAQPVGLNQNSNKLAGDVTASKITSSDAIHQSTSAAAKDPKATPRFAIHPVAKSTKTASRTSQSNSAFSAALAPENARLPTGQSAPLLAALAPAPAPAATISTSQPATGESTPAAMNGYLEVGSFKDAKWADDAVNRLTQLGFHAVCIHKTHLWIKSYRVEVGPFANSTDLNATQQHLAEQGFKSHLVK